MSFPLSVKLELQFLLIYILQCGYKKKIKEEMLQKSLKIINEIMFFE